jgi:hypothetical protein
VTSRESSAIRSRHRLAVAGSGRQERAVSYRRTGAGLSIDRLEGIEGHVFCKAVATAYAMLADSARAYALSPCAERDFQTSFTDATSAHVGILGLGVQPSAFRLVRSKSKSAFLTGAWSSEACYHVLKFSGRIQAMKFKVGESGNPKGKPPGTKNKTTIELREAAREYTEEALKTLVHICQNGKSEQARISAATALLDRGYGKPSQTVQMGTDAESPLAIKIDASLTAKEAAEAYAALVKSS